MFRSFTSAMIISSVHSLSGVIRSSTSDADPSFAIHWVDARLPKAGAPAALWTRGPESLSTSPDVCRPTDVKFLRCVLPLDSSAPSVERDWPETIAMSWPSSPIGWLHIWPMAPEGLALRNHGVVASALRVRAAMSFTAMEIPASSLISTHG